MLLGDFRGSLTTERDCYRSSMRVGRIDDQPAEGYSRMGAVGPAILMIGLSALAGPNDLGLELQSHLIQLLPCGEPIQRHLRYILTRKGMTEHQVRCLYKSQTLV